MSKLLIDRAVLEATLKHAEFVSGAACEADDAIRAVLVAPSGTPELPVKAYYHEAPNEYGGLNKSVGLEVRKTFIDAPLVLESDALAQIACLEGEIAKRDAKYQREVYGLNNESDPIGGDPAGGYANDNARLRTELAAIKAQEPVAWRYKERADDQRSAWMYVKKRMHIPGGHKFEALYAAQVSEAKAQGVVMPERETELFNAAYGAAVESGWESVKCMARQIWDAARLNATPVQQVSVPDGWKLVPVNATEAILDVLYSNGMDESDSLLQDIWSAMLYVAPAAPEADAPVRQATDGGRNQSYEGLFDGETEEQRASRLAAHSAKGVV